jgi:CheY-like chemotaxis protein
MPGMTGWELARKLTGEKPGLKVVYMTGYDIVEEDADIGDLVVLLKPFDPDDLTRTVRALLDGPDPEAPAVAAGA